MNIALSHHGTTGKHITEMTHVAPRDRVPHEQFVRRLNNVLEFSLVVVG